MGFNSAFKGLRAQHILHVSRIRVKTALTFTANTIFMAVTVKKAKIIKKVKGETLPN